MLNPLYTDIYNNKCTRVSSAGPTLFFLHSPAPSPLSSATRTTTPSSASQKQPTTRKSKKLTVLRQSSSIQTLLSSDPTAALTSISSVRWPKPTRSSPFEKTDSITISSVSRPLTCSTTDQSIAPSSLRRTQRMAEKRDGRDDSGQSSFAYKRGSYVEFRKRELRRERELFNVDEFGRFRGGGRRVDMQCLRTTTGQYEATHWIIPCRLIRFKSTMRSDSPIRTRKLSRQAWR